MQKPTLVVCGLTGSGKEKIRKFLEDHTFLLDDKTDEEIDGIVDEWADNIILSGRLNHYNHYIVDGKHTKDKKIKYIEFNPFTDFFVDDYEPFYIDD